MDFIGGNLTALSDLLKESEDAQQRVPAEGQTMKPTPSSGMMVKTGASAAVKKPEEEEEDKERKVDKGKIWTEDEVPDEEAVIDEGDDRPAPRYEFSYKQSVGTEDTFLGMGDKSPATSDCTHLVVKVHFPGSTMKDISLDVTKNRVSATSKTHRLFTYLPVKVKSESGTARFDTKKSVLIVTLPVIHELAGL